MLRGCFDCLQLKNGNDRFQYLWVRIKGKANEADVIVGVCYKPPSQAEEADAMFYKQLGGFL